MNLFSAYITSFILLICGCFLLGVARGFQIGVAALFIAGSIYCSIWVLILKEGKK